MDDLEWLREREAYQVKIRMQTFEITDLKALLREAQHALDIAFALLKYEFPRDYNDGDMFVIETALRKLAEMEVLGG